MSKYLVAAASFFLVLLGANSVSADEDESIEAWRSDWTCGKEVALSNSEIGWLQISHSFLSDGRLPAFIVASLKGPSDASQTVIDRPLLLFVKHGDAAWRAHALAPSSGATNIFVSPETGRAMIFTMWDLGSPGQSYVVATTDDEFQHITCGELPAPATDLGSTDYMQIMSLNSVGMDTQVLRGMVQYGSSDRPNTWFESVTKNGGKTWSTPHEIGFSPMYEAIARHDIAYDDLINSLKRSAK